MITLADFAPQWKHQRTWVPTLGQSGFLHLRICAAYHPPRWSSSSWTWWLHAAIVEPALGGQAHLWGSSFVESDRYSFRLDALFLSVSTIPTCNRQATLESPISPTEGGLTFIRAHLSFFRVMRLNFAFVIGNHRAFFRESISRLVGCPDIAQLSVSW